MAALNPQPDCIDLEQQVATPLVPNARSIRVYNAGGQLAAIKADGSNALPGGAPAGATGDVQFNNNGAFGNANAVFPGAVFSIDSEENLIIDLSANSGGLLLTLGGIIAEAIGNISFQSDQGDISLTASTGSLTVSSFGAAFTATSGDGISFGTTQSSDPSPINFSSNSVINFIAPAYRFTDGNGNAGLQVFANNAAAIAGGLVAGDFYRTSTGQVMVVF